MKNLLIISLLMASLGAMSGCESSGTKASATKAEPSPIAIEIFGSNSCHHCTDFKAKLDSIGLDYIFNDVELNDEHTLVMMDLIKKHGVTGRVNYPVVLVNNDKLLVAPKIGELLNYMQK